MISKSVSNNLIGSAESWAVTDYEYDSRARLIYVTQYDNGIIDNVTAYTYDGIGNTLTMQTGMSSKTANDGKLTTYTYDRFGNQLTLTDALNQSETYQYTALGVLSTKTDRNGNVTTYDYDGLGRLHSCSVRTPENVTNSELYTYTLTGFKRSETNGTVTATYQYDDLGRLVQVSETGNVVKQYTYDLAGNRQTFTATVNGTPVQNIAYTYDEQNRLKTVSDNGTLKATYTYDINGSRASLTYANGVSTAYTYNKANWVTSVTNVNGGNTLSSYAYTYYADGNQRTKTDHNSTVTTYIYDDLGRLTNENVSGLYIAYEYDRSGNRTLMDVDGTEIYTVSYAYDDNNRLISVEKSEGQVTTITSCSYDPNGNQYAKISETVYPETLGDEEFSLDTISGEFYTYNGFNQLVGAFINGASMEYSYRPDRLRFSKKTAEGEVIHLWDGSDIVADFADGNLTKRYVRGIGLILSEDSSGQRYYLYNAHGDVVQLTNSAGAIEWLYDYDAFGNQRDIQGQNPELDTNPFRYCGEYYDLETKTYYLRARNYDPTTGRFLSEDPAQSGLNWYTYCSNNPINLIDPWGLVEIGLRAYAATYEGSVVEWDDETQTASVTWNGETINVASNAQNNRDGHIYVDDSLFVNAFGIGGKLIVYQDAVTNNVSIRASFSYRGEDAYARVPGSESDAAKWGISYSSAFLQAIEDKWSGNIGGLEVSTYARYHGDGIKATFKNELGISHVNWPINWSGNNPGRVTMYAGDNRNNPDGNLYSFEDYRIVAAHEFGHILGIKDGYNNPKGKDTWSIMSKQWETGGATLIDIQKALQAWSTGRTQGWK